MTDGIPYDAEIEYLESTGTQYVDTLTPMDASLRVVMDYACYNTLVRPFGAADVRGTVKNQWYLVNDRNQAASNCSLGSTTNAKINIGQSPVGVRTTATIDGRNLSAYGGTATMPSWTLTPKTDDCTLGIFACHVIRTDGSNPWTLHASMQLYSCAIYDGSTLVRDFVPVRVGTVGYLFDRVTRRLYGNAGSGSFVLGPDVARPVLPARAVSVKPYDAEIEYLDRGREDGTIGEGPYIDTGMVFPTKYYYSIDCYLYAPYAVNQSAYHGAGQLTIIHPNRQPYCLGLLGNDQIVAPARYTLDRVKINRDTTGRSFVFFNMRFGGNGGFNRGSRSRLYRFTVWNAQNTLIADFIPVRRGTTGYLYDKVSGQLFGNAGTGSFALGPDVRVERPLSGLVPVARNVRVLPYDAEVDYIESTGKQYVDTGIVPTDDHTIYCLFNLAISGNSKQACVFGCDATSGSNSLYIVIAGDGHFVYKIGSNSGTNWPSSNAFANNPFEVSFSNKKVIVVMPSNPTHTRTISGSALSVDRSLLLFRRQKQAYNGGRILACSISLSGTPVRDYIPVRVGSVGYLYDRANPTGGPLGNGLYGSATDTPLIAGPDK